jgi:hypothetical protein
MKTTANQLLNKAASHMEQRATVYDKPKGERSMRQAVSAFNAITGTGITTSQGWLLLTLLKFVRDQSREAPHVDSVEDAIAYAALYGEERLADEAAQQERRRGPSWDSVSANEWNQETGKD